MYLKPFSKPNLNPNPILGTQRYFESNSGFKIFRASGEAILGTLKLFPKRLVVGFQRKTGEQTKITTRNSTRKSRKPAKRKQKQVLYLNFGSGPRIGLLQPGLARNISRTFRGNFSRAPPYPWLRDRVSRALGALVRVGQ